MNHDEFNKLSVSEFPQTTQEFQSSSDNKAAAEVIPSIENPQPKETTDRKAEYSPNKKTNKNLLQSLLPKMIAVLTATTTVFATTIINLDKTKVNFLELAADATAIYYHIDIKDSQEELWLHLENDFTSRKAPLTEGENSGSFEGLASDMHYSLYVRKATGYSIGGGTKTIKTLKHEPSIDSGDSSDIEVIPPKTEFYGFETTPADSTEGEFTFVAMFEDEQDIWSNVSVTLSDLSVVDGYEPLPDLTIENIMPNTSYKMSLADWIFFTSQGTLTAYADVLLENGQTERQAIYSEEIDFISKKTGVESFSVTPAEELGGNAETTLTFIDENNLWVDASLALYLRSTEGGEAYQHLVSSSPDTGQFSIYSYFIQGDTGVFELQLSMYVNDVYYTVCLFIEEHLVKGENFVDEYTPNDSTGY